MIPREITELEMEADLAAERASAAKSRAKIAALEHQRALVGQRAPVATANTGVSWLVLLFAVVVAFALGRAAPAPSMENPDEHASSER